MALETCFQVSTIASTAAAAATTCRFVHAPVGHRDKLHLAAGSAAKRATVVSSLLSSPATVASPLGGAGDARRSRLVCRAKNVVDEVLVADEKNWDNMVLASKSPVLVEFYAHWCSPCQLIKPVIEELAKDYANKIVCCKVNTDDSPSIASNYGIRSIPTVLMFKDGQKKETVIGSVPKSTLSTIIDKYLEG